MFKCLATTLYFQHHVVGGEDQRGQRERKKANTTKENKDAKLMPIIFRCYWLDLFLCLLR